MAIDDHEYQVDLRDDCEGGECRADDPPALVKIFLTAFLLVVLAFGMWLVASTLMSLL